MRLLRSGILREYIEELRGDKRSEAITIHHHIDRKELRKSLAIYSTLDQDLFMILLFNQGRLNDDILLTLG